MRRRCESRQVCSPAPSAPPVFQNGCDNVVWKNAVRALCRKRFDYHPPGMPGCIGPIHQIDPGSPRGDFGVFLSARKIQLKSRRWLPGGFDFRAFDCGVEIHVDRGAVHDLRNLITGVVIIEDISIQRKGAVEQRIFGPSSKALIYSGLNVSGCLAPYWRCQNR